MREETIRENCATLTRTESNNKGKKCKIKHKATTIHLKQEDLSKKKLQFRIQNKNLNKHFHSLLEKKEEK